MTVPDNWLPAMASDGVVTYAPEGGFFQGSNGRTGFTHGLQVGVLDNATGNLQRDTEQMLQGFARTNPQLRRQEGYRRENVGGRTGLTTVLSNVSDVTGEAETVTVSTAQLRDNRVLFLIGVAPQREAATYANAFQRARRDLRIADR
jgi:hypothetical protein